MRNLKRALSMGLASTMVMGMMATGAGAASFNDFTDKDEIVHKEAVAMVTELGVIAGVPGGGYDPTSNIDRASFARLCCVVLNGGVEPVLGADVKSTFSDTQGHWAEAYIAYCVEQGIVAGRGNNTFAPGDNVTGSAAAKMLLVALGYNTQYENIGGAGWQLTTDTLANSVGLYDGLESMNTSEPITRDQAAQMIYNALNADTVKYEMVTGISPTGQVTVTPQRVYVTRLHGATTRNVTLLEDKFKAVRVEGEVVANEFADLRSTHTDKDLDTRGNVVGSALEAGKSRIYITNGEELYVDFLKDNTSYVFNTSTGEDELGKSVYFFLKPDGTALKSKVLGNVVISEDNNIVVDTSGDTAKGVADDNSLHLNSGTVYAYNYSGASATAPAGKDGVKGIQKVLIDTDGDTYVDYVLYNEKGLGKVTLWTEAKDGQIVVANDKGSYVNKDKDDIIGFEDVEKDDYVLAAYVGGRLYVEKAETVTGKIEAYKQKNDKATGGYLNTGFTIDGQSYDVSYVETYEGSDLTAAKKQVDKTILSSEATFYQDQNGFVIAYGEVDETAYKYAYVWGAEASTSALTDDKVKVTLENGTTGTYVVNSNSQVDIVPNGQGANATGSAKAKIEVNEAKGLIFGYTLTSNGQIKLTLPKGGAVKSATVANYPSFTKGLTAIRMGSKAAVDVTRLAPAGVDAVNNINYYSNNATTFFYVTTKDDGSVDKVTVYNGRNNAPTLNGDEGSALLALRNEENVGAAAFTDVGVAESAGDHMFIFDANYVWEDYGYVDAFFNGETESQENIKVALKEDGEIVHNPTVNDGIYLYKTNSNGYYELTDPDDQSYYFEGVVTRVNKASNTFVIGSVTNHSNVMHEFRLTNSSVVVDYDSSHSSPIAHNNAVISKGDLVQVIVNNADDSNVLMAAIMEREQVGGNTGVSVDWAKPSGAQVVRPMDTPDDIDNIRKAFQDKDAVVVDGNLSLSDSLTIPRGCTLYVDGDLTAATGKKITNNGTLMVKGTLTTAAVQNTLDGTVKAIDLTTNGNITVKGSVTLEDDIAAGGDITVADKATLIFDVANMGTHDFTVQAGGHAEGTDILGTGNVTVLHSTSLVLSGTLTCNTLTVGDGTTSGRVVAQSVTANTVTLTDGTITLTGALAKTGNAAADVNLTKGTLTVGSLNADLSGWAAEANVVVNNNATLSTDTTVPAGASLTVKGNLSTTNDADLTIEGSADIGGNVDTGDGDITVAPTEAAGTATMKVGGTVDAGTVTVGTSGDNTKKGTLTVKGEVTATTTTINKGSSSTTGKVNGNVVAEADTNVTAPEITGSTTGEGAGDVNVGTKGNTANVAFALTTPSGDGNTITGGGETKTVAVNVVNATESVVITATKTANQNVAKGGTNADKVTIGTNDTAPTFTVNTTEIKTGGSVSFTVTVSETGKEDITYTVTVTVAETGTPDPGEETLYTVTFDGNQQTSGSAPAAIKQTAANQAITLPEVGDLVKTDHTFGGWNSKADGSGTTLTAKASYTPDADVTLYAVWTPNTSDGYTLTLPSGVTATYGDNGTSVESGTTKIPADETVTLAGSLPTAYYLKADTTYVKSDSATFTMPAKNVEITVDKYYKVTVSIDGNTGDVSTNLGGVTVATSFKADTYVKAGEATTVTFTLGSSGKVVTNPIKIAMGAVTGVSSSKYSTAAELLAVNDTQDTDISSKADSITIDGDTATDADLTITYTLSTGA